MSLIVNAWCWSFTGTVGAIRHIEDPLLFSAGVRQKLRVLRIFKKWATRQDNCDVSVMTSAQCHLFLLHRKSPGRTVPRASLAAMGWLVREPGAPFRMMFARHIDKVAQWCPRSRVSFSRQGTSPMDRGSSLHYLTARNSIVAEYDRV